MSKRAVAFKLLAKETRLAGEATVYRALPRRELRRVGGFVFFDHFDAENVRPEDFDIPPHPHVGLQTVSYLFDGELLHTDSLGFQQIIKPGEVNLMTAGRAITHSEQAMQNWPRMHGVQSWIGLPHSRRQMESAFEHYGAEQLPIVEFERAALRVLMGNAGDAVSPIETQQSLTYLDLVTFGAAELTFDTDESHELAVYVCEGAAEIDGTKIERFELAKLTAGRDLALTTTSATRLIVFGGEPLAEPTVVYWNFVTDTLDEAREAMKDWEAGRFPLVEKYERVMSLET